MKKSGLFGAIFFVAACTAIAAHAETPPAASVDTANPQVQEQAHQLAARPPLPPSRGHRVVADLSGRKQSGSASVYAKQFHGKRMADGKRFDSDGHSAASKTLPLGTVAKVTNLETGRTAVVTVEDHGPFIDGRTLDVSTATSRQLGIGPRKGIAQVLVAPVAIPQPDGSVKPGAGAVPGPATAQ